MTMELWSKASFNLCFHISKNVARTDAEGKHEQYDTLTILPHCLQNARVKTKPMRYNYISMRKTDVLYYCDMPVPSFEEQEVLWDLAFEPSDTYHSLTDVAHTATQLREEIRYVIDRDQQFFLDHEITPQLTLAEAQHAVDGIELGYNFIIGAITYVHYLRRTTEETDVHDFLYDLPPDTELLPLAQPAAQQRMVDCITGVALAEISPGYAQTTPGQRSPAIAASARSYLAETPLLSAVIERQQDLLYMQTYSDEKPGESAYADGFGRGVEGGIALYIESHHSAQIASMRTLLS